MTEKCLHDSGVEYVVREDGVWMQCIKCHRLIAKATKFESRDVPENLFEQIDRPKILEK